MSHIQWLNSYPIPRFLHGWGSAWFYQKLATKLLLGTKRSYLWIFLIPMCGFSLLVISLQITTFVDPILYLTLPIHFMNLNCVRILVISVWPNQHVNHPSWWSWLLGCQREWFRSTNIATAEIALGKERIKYCQKPKSFRWEFSMEIHEEFHRAAAQNPESPAQSLFNILLIPALFLMHR